jgi:hypothetical protein
MNESSNGCWITGNFIADKNQYRFICHASLVVPRRHVPYLPQVLTRIARRSSARLLLIRHDEVSIASCPFLTLSLWKIAGGEAGGFGWHAIRLRNNLVLQDKVRPAREGMRLHI